MVIISTGPIANHYRDLDLLLTYFQTFGGFDLYCFATSHCYFFYEFVNELHFVPFYTPCEIGNF